MIVDGGHVAIFTGGDVGPALFRPFDAPPYAVVPGLKRGDPPRRRSGLAVHSGKFKLVVIIHGDVERAVVRPRLRNHGNRIAGVRTAPVPP